MYCIKKKEYIRELESIQSKYENIKKENYELKESIKNNNELIKKLSNKIECTNSLVLGIYKDKEGYDSFICMKDNRKPELDCIADKIYKRGLVDLFVINQNICIGTSKKIIDMPYLMADFFINNVEIIELHSNTYENKGYGTMLIESLKKLASESDCKKIYGKLSWVDAKTDEKRDKRNGFYEKRGFKVEFDDDMKKNGRIEFTIG